MKKILSFLLALMMVSSLFVGMAEDGTFTGVGKGGKAGDVSVEVTIENGALKDINILPNEETVGLGDVAMEDLKNQMLTGNTVDVEAMAQAAAQLDIPAVVSNSAGAFVCNDVLYTLLHHFDGTDTKVGFIHVPWLPEQGSPSLPLASTVKALTAMIPVCNFSQKSENTP